MSNVKRQRAVITTLMLCCVLGLGIGAEAVEFSEAKRWHEALANLTRDRFIAGALPILPILGQNQAQSRLDVFMGGGSVSSDWYRGDTSLTAAGVTGALDVASGRQSRIGLAFGLHGSSAKPSLPDLNGDFIMIEGPTPTMKGRGNQLGVYGAYRPEGMEIQGVFVHGQTNYDMSQPRQEEDVFPLHGTDLTPMVQPMVQVVEVPDDNGSDPIAEPISNRTMIDRATWNGTHTSLVVRFIFGEEAERSMAWRPIVGLAWHGSKLAVSEAADASVDRRTNRTETEIGVRMESPVFPSGKGWRIQPMAYVGVIHPLATSRTETAEEDQGFSAQSAPGFSDVHSEGTAARIAVGIGANSETNPDWSYQIGYEGRFHRHSRNYGFHLGFQVGF